MNRILRVIAKIVFSLVWIALLLAVLLCPNYIANPVVTSVTDVLCPGCITSVLQKLAMDTGIYDYTFSSMLVTFRQIILQVWGAATVLVIAGTYIFMYIRKKLTCKKISIMETRRRKKVAFCVFLLLIVVARANPVTTTLIRLFITEDMPLKTAYHLLGYNVDVGSGATIYFYTTLIGQYFMVHYSGEDTLLLNTVSFNYPYLIHMILIATFVAVTRLGICIRDRWLRRAQPSQPENPAQEEP